MFCTKCGNKIIENAKFCDSCGVDSQGDSSQPGVGINTQPPGRIFLMVAGIAYIILGVLAVIMGLFLEIIGQTLDGLGGMAGIAEAGEGFSIVAFLSVAIGGFSFVIGIMGIVHRSNLGKAGTLLVLGAISLVADIVSGLVFGAFSMTTFLFLAVPICYIIGAYKNGGYSYR